MEHRTGHSFVKSTPSGNTTVPINEPADSNPYQRCSIVTAISEHGPYHPFLNQQTRKRCISARQKRSDLLPSPTSCRISNYFPRWHTISNLPSLRIKRYPNEHWFSIYNRIGAPQSKFLLSKGVMVRERCELSQICNQIARSQPSGGSLNISDGVPDSLVVVLEDCRRKSRLCYVVMMRGRDGSVLSPVHSDDSIPLMLSWRC